MTVDDRADGGPEAAARAARYAALQSEAAARQATIWLGHTLDDQAENVLLGLARGSGLRSLAGIAAREPAGWSGRLLGLRRSVTEQACAELGLDPWQRPAQRRPPVRPRTRPPDRAAHPGGRARAGGGRGPGPDRRAGPRGCRPARPLAADADPGTDTLDARGLLDLPTALRTRVIRRWLLRHGADEVTARHVAAVDALVTRWHGQGEIHLPGVRVTRQDGSLHCQPDE